MTRGWSTLLAFSLASGSDRSAHAEPEPSAPESTTGTYSAYEQSSIDQAADQLGTRVDATPEGKLIERIDTVQLKVFERRDPLPGFLNIFHIVTKPYVIDRELLLRQGDRYRRIIADETARNLRSRPQHSLVIVTALKGSQPDRVRLLVITKDVWSLRLNWNVQVGAGGLQQLDLQPSERNIFGTQQTANLQFSYLPQSLFFGGGYRVPRLDGRRLELTADAGLIINHKTGTAEGAVTGVVLTRPLYSTRTEWGYTVGYAARDEVARRYVDARVGTFNADATTYDDKIPFEYHARRFTGQAAVTRSFGWKNKIDILFGTEMNLRQYRTPNLEAFDPAAVSEFLKKNVPVSEDRVGPFFEAHAYTTNFMRVLELETMGLQEDYRVGHDLFARIYPVTRALGSSRDLFGTFVGAQYTQRLGDGLVRVGVDSTNEFTSSGVTDGALSANLRVASPRLGFGRLIFDATALVRYANYLNRTLSLGGNGRLRGYPTNFFVGKNLVAANLEYRTRALQVFSSQISAAAFWDVGDVPVDWSKLAIKHSVGAGLRFLFPQFDRVVFRIDLGVPIPSGGSLPQGVSPVSFFATFGQAFGVDTIGGTGAGVTTPTGGALGQ